MNRREINAQYNKLITAAEKIVFDAIAKYCKKKKCKCMTNGPFGTRFYWRDKTATHINTIEIETPKEIEKLVCWYEDMFGEIPQDINDSGEWVQYVESKH